MKKHIVSIVVALVAIFTLVFTPSAFAEDFTGAGLVAPKRVKKETIAPPSGAFERQLLVYEGKDAVTYAITGKDGVYSSFTANHAGKLLYLRLVISDNTVYEWDVTYCDDGQVKTWGEDGQHLDNKVTINPEKWLKFFREKVAVPMELFPANSSLKLVNSDEWEFVEYGKGLCWFIRNGRGTIREIQESELLFPFPTTGKFFLAEKRGLFLPLLKTEDGKYSVPVGPKDVLAP